MHPESPGSRAKKVSQCRRRTRRATIRIDSPNPIRPSCSCVFPFSCLRRFCSPCWPVRHSPALSAASPCMASRRFRRISALRLRQSGRSEGRPDRLRRRRHLRQPQSLHSEEHAHDRARPLGSGVRPSRLRKPHAALGQRALHALRTAGEDRRVGPGPHLHPVRSRSESALVGRQAGDGRGRHLLLQAAAEEGPAALQQPARQRQEHRKGGRAQRALQFQGRLGPRTAADHRRLLADTARACDRRRSPSTRRH